MRTTALLCLLYLLCPLAWGDGRSAQQLSELNSRSHLLCVNALLYFNPHDRAPDPRSLTAVFYHLNTLETYVLQLGQPDVLSQPLLAMRKLFTELDGLPYPQRERYPQLVQQLLIERQKLQQAADTQYTRSAPLHRYSCSILRATPWPSCCWTTSCAATHCRTKPISP